MPRQNLKVRFCERFRCPDSDYEIRAFRKCLYLHAKALAPLVRLLNPACFEEDLKLVRYLGETTGPREASREVLSFQDGNRARPGFLRGFLRIRVSGRRANALATEVFQRLQFRQWGKTL